MAQFVISWTASFDAVGVTGYFIERCQGVACSGFAQVASVLGSPPVTTYTDTGLLDSTTYRYRIRAGDAAGNLSGYSSIATGVTPSPGDTTPPSVPTNVTVT